MGEVKRKGGGTWVVGKKKGGVCGWWGKKKEKKEINNVIIKFKSKNQNYVPNTIFFLNCDFSCETKAMYQTEFFL